MDSPQDHATARLAWLRDALGDSTATLTPASTDASFRSYWRTSHGGQSWILMDSPPAQEDPAAWIAIGARLAAAGLHVPAVHAQNLQQGFLLIEDFGDRLYLPALNAGSVDALYADAMEALLCMQRDVDVAGMPPYDRAFLQRELEIMPEWFLGTHLGYTPKCGEWDVLEAAFTQLLASALEQPRCFVHRDFHSRNLLVVEHDNPGIIDFQGARLGPITYDLASLLRDCYLTWDRQQVEAWAESHRRRLRAAQLIGADVDRERFRRWFDLIGLQRHIKVLGIFCRLHYRDGKHGYLADLPRVYDYVIEVAGRYPALAEFVVLLRRCVGPRDLRQPAAA
ncbi:MAG: aminoglycoside phosphotransferase [Rhodanobacter sp.]|nr:MAG: aminoglycoside phosphotransferase [Rhodanobacter sp.]TAL99953.1 MAG: aminoglycoside phosphotransferase [Rhodanobacter sp.]TAM38201.1 MAG: aminoglycoside phosphotransferase [Rhodanobacter sp.]TAN26421.1 MAG: aminoglycoside phosphotransferase [Rhodanobacter sp.]